METPLTRNGNKMELYTTGTGQKVWVHPKIECLGNNCVIHNPSDHSMKDFPTHWRDDRRMMERICPHGVGHPDPDDIAFKAQFYGWDWKQIRRENTHGCDGCCHG